jgi:prepilin-type processing-associated H-X9-DG protein
MLFILPQIEQENLYRQINWGLNSTFPKPTANPANLGPAGDARGRGVLTNNTKISTYRCPSDGWEVNQSLANYAGSLGPQCSTGGIGVDPHQQFCNQPAWNIAPSPDHGNEWYSAQNIRGAFNRLGVQFNFASIADGLSNTILIGEVLPEEHDHYWGPSWTHFNGGVAHHTTIVPINYRSDIRVGHPCSGVDPLRCFANWNVAWGFKSRHAGGANFLFGDGSVQFLREAIDHRTYNLLGARSDKLPVAIP